MFRKRSKVRDILLITVGVLFLSAAVKYIYDPMQLVTGGVSGISIMLRALFGIPLWISNIVINIPLFYGGYRIKGWSFIRRTMFATVLMTVMLALLPEYQLIPGDDLFLGAVFGAILTGAGSGMVLVAMATTGGTDLMASIVQSKYRQFSVPQIMQVIDCMIILAGIGLFGISRALYAVVSVYVITKVSDYIVDGLHFAKAMFIISPKYEEVSKRIMEELDRGVTGIEARGMYSDVRTQMIYCVLSKREMTYVKDIVAEIDPNAFVIISDVREVLGEGFTREKRNVGQGS